MRQLDIRDCIEASERPRKKSKPNEAWLDKTGHIYVWRTPNGPYVGQSKNVEKRLRREARGKSGCPPGLKAAIEEHGLDACTSEILEACANRDLNVREKYWIQKEDSYHNGLNRTKGGQRGFTRATMERFEKYRAETWPYWEALYQSFFEEHGHLDVPQYEPIIGTHMNAMRKQGSFRKEFDQSFPGEFWTTHRERMWVTTYEPLYRAFFEQHGHLNVPIKEPVIGKQMHTMRCGGCYREEFDASFPGEFWSSCNAYRWTVEYEPLYRAYLERHGHLNVPQDEPVIGQHMCSMRSQGGYREEFEAAFPGEFWESSRAYRWTVKLQPLYAAYLDKHGHLDVPQKEPVIGQQMSNMRTMGAFREEFEAAFPGLFWESHDAYTWTVIYEPLYRAYLNTHGHLNVHKKEPVIGTHMCNMRTMGVFREEFDVAFPGEFWPSHCAYKWEVILRPLFAAYLAKHGHLDVRYAEPIIGSQMSSMRAQGSFREEFDAAFPGEFWPSHCAYKWEVILRPLFAAYLKRHGHLNVRYGEPIIGKQMSSMRAQGSFREEFDAAFPGEFWPSHKAFLESRR